MFLGEYSHSLDEKGRVVMPSKFRQRLERGCVVTKGQERCLFVFPMDQFDEEANKVLSLMSKAFNLAGRFRVRVAMLSLTSKRKFSLILRSSCTHVRNRCFRGDRRAFRRSRNSGR